MIGRFFVGMIVVICGIVGIYYSGPISQTIGRSGFADQYLGGTRNAVILFGFLVAIMGVLFAFGVFEGSSPMDVQTSF